MNNPESVKLVADKSLADKALEAADAAVLHRMFNEKCDDINKLLHGIRIMLDNGQGQLRPSDTAITAMRDVCLAAIDMARQLTAEQERKT